MKPVIVVNFKAYPESVRDGFLLANLLSPFSNVIMCVPAPLICSFARESSLNGIVRDALVFAEHVDPVSGGAYTGSITVDMIKAAGASGSLVNHSEKRLSFNDIAKVVNLLRSRGLASIICCESVKEARRFKKLMPDYIAYEPRELIGSDVSVTTKPGLIKSIVKAVSPVPVLVGAGVKTREDIKTSLSLGASGVLIASGVVKAVDKERAVRDLVVWD